MIEYMMKTHGVDYVDSYYGSSMGMVHYLTIMLSSKTTEKEHCIASVKLNKVRIAKGKTPLADHRIVRIVPEAYIRQSRAEAGGASRLPPRMHWRRSHIRTIHRDEPNKRKMLISRCLIGKPENGSVSHEYKIG